MRRRSLLLPLLSLLISTQLSRAADPAPPAPRPADLYFMAGQSNMQGSGTVADLPDPQRQPVPNASFWNGSTFEPLTPGRTRSPGTTQFGPEISFASTITAASPNRDVLIVKFALSGQPLHAGWDGSTWLGLPPSANRKTFYPGTSPTDPNTGLHYLAMRRTFLAALNHLRHQNTPFTIRGFLWMQGEQDAKHPTSATNYATSLRLLKHRLEQDTNQNTPVPLVFGQVLPHDPPLPRFTHRSEIRTSQSHADATSGHPDAIPGTRMIPTDNFPLLPDTVHYNTAGQLQLGRTMATAILKLQAPP
jgi:hypothetical protein